MVTTAYDSLVIGEVIEVWGPPGGIASTNPMCPGASFRIQPPFSLGAPQPTTDFVASLVVDGERPFGDRASDRTISLNVLIKAPDYKTLAGARELLLKTIDQPHWPLVWTRASGADPGALPLVLDCFRAQPSVLPMGGPEEFRPQGRNQYETQVTVTFEALPYGRSDTQQQVAFAAPIASINGPAAPPAPIVLDAFSTINSPQCTQSALHIVGPNSCCWDPQNGPFFRPDGQNAPLTYTAPISGAPVSFIGMTSLTMWLGLASRYYFNHHPRGQTRVVMSFSLTDSNSVTLSWAEKSLWLPVSADPQNPVFTQVTAHIPQNSGTFNYGSVSSYSLTITNRAPRWDTPGGELRWTTAYLDALTAQPSSQVIATPSPRGNVYTLYGVAGTHRTPVSMQFQQAPSAGTPSPITTTGAGTYTVPGGTVYLKVEAVGGGGAGATQTVSGFGGGGGGAEYAAEPIFPATVSAVIQYVVGAGDTAGASASTGKPTTFGPAPGGTLAVNAAGGVSAVQNSTIGGAGGTGSVNSVHFPGGPGRTASGSVGGGGGSSGGNASAGNTPTGTAATLFTSPGTANWTCPAGVISVFAECWGSGGSGGTGSSNSNGAGGAGGEYAAANVAVTPGNLYSYTVAAAGAAVGPGSGLTGNNGSSSTFTGDAVTVTAHGGTGGFASGSSHTGPNGGSGSSNTVHFNGGAGGGNSPYGGGGGSSAGTASAGNAGSNYGSAGTAPSGGGNGGAGTGGSGGNGTAGMAPGGGGGGTYYSSTTSGAGAAGQVRLTYPGGAPTNNGGVAVAGGGAGGAGGPSANTVGSAGSQPGGGGGGADSSGSTEAGGAGGNGKLIITPYASAAFKTLVVHRPGVWSPPQLNPFVPVGAGLVAPGATEYTVPSLVSGVGADFNGTYTVMLTNFSFNNPSAARTISVTVRQYEVLTGAHYDTTTTPISVIPNTQAINGLLVVGTLTLPLKAVAGDNTGGYYTVLVSDTNGSDRWYDCLFLDVQGQTVIINEPTTGYINYYFDEPDPCHDLGNYLGSQLGRPTAISVTDAMTISGGPLTIEPGTNTLMAYAQEGAPSISLSYWPRWYNERLE
jgi:hypothetical protein